MRLKLEMIRYATSHSIHAAAKKYNVDRSSIRQWRKNEDKLAEMINEKQGSSKRLHLDGAGRHVTNANIEENLLEWIFVRRSMGIRVSRKFIMIKATKLQKRETKPSCGETVIQHGLAYQVHGKERTNCSQ